MEWEKIEQLIKSKVSEVAKEIEKAAQESSNEATFRERVSFTIHNLCNEAGITALSKEEYTVASGRRSDTVFSRLVIEYKAPGLLRKFNDYRNNMAAITQLKEYIKGVAKRERWETQKLAGVVMDGKYFIFLRRLKKEWHIDEPLEINRHSVERFLRLLVSFTSGIALTSENLIKRLGIERLCAQKMVSALEIALRNIQHPLVDKLFKQWRIFFSEVIEYKEAFTSPKLRELKKFAQKAGIELKEAEGFFFAIHTYFALLVKLLAWLALSRYVGGRLGAPVFGRLQALSSDELKRELSKMEEGGIFKEFGVRNLLEGDFFSWYLYAWNDKIEDALRVILKHLSDYDPTTLEVNPEETRDLLKKLYHYLLPREIRHNLGEYYTPDWLAQRLLNQIDRRFFTDEPEESWYLKENLLKLRFLDPACGSGTFLVLIIKRIKEIGEKLLIPDKVLLEAILKNVVGIDLNPLAVIAARTTYLLALGNLLEQAKGEIDIPVYLADSVLTPSAKFFAEKYSFKTAVGEFVLPKEVFDREKIDIICNLLDEGVRDQISEGAFLERCRHHLKMSVEFDKIASDFTTLYQTILNLHKDGLNGIWARIVKNAFAPLFIGKFDYVVGNPPWVNWENLPEDYRNRMVPLYQDVYKLFPHKGFRARHGSAKIDISSLMAYVSMDKYLERGGKLGFLITQSLLKTDAGKGFRKFNLFDKIPLRVVHVDDMVELNPFEGAANRTAVIVLEKGKSTRYPVSYTYWRKTTKGKPLGYDNVLKEVEDITARMHFKAEPVDKEDLASSWITGRPQALKAIKKILGKSDYEAHEGVNTGGANAVYWVGIIKRRPDGLVVISNITKGAKREVESVQVAIEPDLLYPLLRGRDVKRWKAEPSVYIIIPQDPKDQKHGYPEKRLQIEFPKTYSYLKRFKALLSNRPAYVKYLKGEPFYSLYDVKKYTFTPYKVIWTRIANIETAVVSQKEEKSIIPQETLSLVALDNEDEAHYLCAMVNSSPFQYATISYSQAGGKSMGSPHVLENIHIPKFDHKNKLHIHLAELSKKAHDLASKGDEESLKAVESQIDSYAAQLWDITDKELQSIKLSLGKLQSK